ncbi:MAG: site-specific integrase [Rhodococcus erythropolis]
MYRDSTGARRTCDELYTRKSDALRAANAAEAKERKSPTPAGKMTWGEWEILWSETRVVASSTARSDDARRRDHLRPKWENELLRNITTVDVQRWIVELRKQKLAPSTIQKCYYLLSASMKAAVGARHIEVNPCKGIDLPKVGPQPDRYLESFEIEAIMKALNDFDGFMTSLLVGTGMRLGESLALHWQSVDLDRSQIRIEWAYDPVAKEMKSPKDYQARTIPIGVSLAEKLADRFESRSAMSPMEYPKGAKIHSGLVLAHTLGRPVDSNNFRHRFEAAVRASSVAGTARIHDLRHTYASSLLRAGVPLEEVSRLMGHASILTTMRYAHLAKSHWDKVRDALG